MEFESGDRLLVKLQGRKGSPATPDGKVYSDTKIKIQDSNNPVWEYKESGAIVPIKVVHNGELVGKWVRVSPTQYHTLHKKWIATLENRNPEFAFDELADEIQDGTQSGKSIENVIDDMDAPETTESQDRIDSTMVEEEDEWSKSKSEVMNELSEL